MICLSFSPYLLSWLFELKSVVVLCNEEISHHVANNSSNERSEANECTTLANELTNHIASFGELSLWNTEKTSLTDASNQILAQLVDGDKSLKIIGSESR
jgi:hypothetical protein